VVGKVAVGQNFPCDNDFVSAVYIRGGTQKKPESFSGGRARCSTYFRLWMPLAGTLLRQSADQHRHVKSWSHIVIFFVKRFSLVRRFL
jgi:hypothetical protein